MQIRRVRIKRFRGLEDLTWHPSPGLNCLIGPGDVGKSTVLEGIATVLSSAPGRVASEHDYFDGAVNEEFVVEVVLGRLDEEVLSAWPAAPLWTWMAEKKVAQAAPDPDGEGVLCLRAKGTEDLEIEHVVVDPSEGETFLSPSKRQKFGLSAFSSATTAYRELRMSRGSLLSRNVEQEQLRNLVTEAVQTSRDNFTPPAEVEARLRELSQALAGIAPGTGDLTLAMLSPRGQNLLGMIALFTKAANVEVPLANAGLGTQQLALFTLARLLIAGSPLFVIDEIESGLEPFRQRDLIGRIRNAIGSDGQAFITTHSPAAIGEMAIGELYRLNPSESGSSSVSAYPADLETIKDADPEALLCRIPIVGEGQTELGLLDCLLEEQAKKAGTTLGALGVRLVDGGGQPKVFSATSALRGIGLRFGAFLDTEDTYKGKREELAGCERVAFGTYTGARCLEAALAAQLTLEALDRLVAAPRPDGRDPSTSRYQQLNELAGNPSRKTLVELSSQHSEARCRELFRDAADKSGWFKTRENGFVVGEFLRDHYPDVGIVRDVADFWAATANLISDQLPTEGPADAGTEA